ncbi:MAG: diguanylate cyclase [Lachnospiraceae bacterium]|nr:diguanylate cyclase [Lachnospiraceae bacterium]
MNLISLITKDVEAKNETKKVMVTLRVVYLVIALAFLLDMILAGCDVFLANKWGFLAFYSALIILLWGTYHSRTRVSTSLFMIYLVIWTIYMIPKLGWSAGMQNYFIILLLVVFFGSYDKLIYKFIYSGLVLAMRIVLIITMGLRPAVTRIPETNNKLMQIVNISAVFASIICFSYSFSRTEKDEEGKLVQYNNLLQKEAHTDQLTGLYNRRKAKEYMEELINASNGESISVAIGDIDFFKKVNDNYGHDAGDEVLKEIARIMTDTLRSSSFIARWGGEEFLIIFPNCNGDQAKIALERLRRIIENTVMKVKDDEIRITITFGLAEYDFSNDMEAIIKEADEHLYFGKENGRNQVVF